MEGLTAALAFGVVREERRKREERGAGTYEGREKGRPMDKPIQRRAIIVVLCAITNKFKVSNQVIEAFSLPTYLLNAGNILYCIALPHQQQRST